MYIDQLLLDLFSIKVYPNQLLNTALQQKSV